MPGTLRCVLTDSYKQTPWSSETSFGLAPRTGTVIDSHGITFRMVNVLVRISRFQILIGHECIGIDHATSGNVALDFTVKRFLATIRNHSGARMD